MIQDKLLTSLLLITAVLLSTTAAYYSIAGLASIFAAAVVPVVVMGSVLELAKIIVTSWIYRNWQDTPRTLRTYFVSAIVALMFLTSMGIFGFLSKAHTDQNLVSGDVQSKLALIDERIRIEKENIDANRNIISQLDSQVNATLGRSTDESGAARSATLRRSQAKERSQAQAQILSAQEKVRQLNEERSPIAAEVRSVEAEVGPVKYIAQLVYGQEAGQDTLEKAVRLVILLIVFVFDPLAVLMFIAVNQDLKKQVYPKVVIEDNHDSYVSHSSHIEPIIDNEKQFDDIMIMSDEDWTEYFAQTPDPKVDLERDVTIEESNRQYNRLLHIQVNDSLPVVDKGNLKVDKGMHGIFSQTF